MVSAAGSTKTKRVLLGRSGTENSFGQLADGLRSEGFKVVEEKSSPVGAHSSIQAVKEVLQGIDVVLLVVHKNDGVPGPTPPFQRVLHDAKVIQESIGDGRVVLLVEESVDGLPDTGITHIRFPSSRADMILQDVVNKIGVATVPPPVRDLHARIPMGEQARSSALRVPWLLVLVVLISAAIPIAVAINALRSSDEPARQRLFGVATALQTPASAATGAGGEDAASVADNGTSSGSTTAVDPSDSQPADRSVEPAAPAVTLGADNELLPAACQIDVTKDSLLDGAATCDDAGRLVLEGRAGPWHNEIRAIAVDDGVLGELHYEVPASGSTSGPAVLELKPGTLVLNEGDARLGVAEILVRFSAHGQHVHLFANADGSGEFATLTFTLDR